MTPYHRGIRYLQVPYPEAVSKKGLEDSVCERKGQDASMRALILILGAVLGMSEKRVQFKLAATVAYETVPSRAQTLGEAAGLREVKRVFRHAPKHEAKHRAQGLHLWYTGAAATAADADRAVAQLQADPDVASAELDQEVQML